MKNFWHNPLPPLLPRKQYLRRRLNLIEGPSVAFFAALVVCAFVFSSADRFVLRSNQYAAVIASVLVDLTNSDRSVQSLGTLKVNPVLVEAAKAKANDMATRGYFAHVGPDGRDSWHWFKFVGYDFSHAGENLAVDFSDSIDVERAWMNSPTHKANIVNGEYTEIGIATAEGMYRGRPTTFVVQMFGKPAARNLAVASAPTEAVVPENPTEPASAITESEPLEEAQVLGETAAQEKTEPVPPEAEVSVMPYMQQPLTPMRENPPPSVSEVSEVAPDYAPFWAHVMASPRTTLRYAYYGIGILILLALIITIGLEWHWHHIRKAVAAGSLLVFMLVLFFVADVTVFSTPILALGSP